MPPNGIDILRHYYIVILSLYNIAVMEYYTNSVLSHYYFNTMIHLSPFILNIIMIRALKKLNLCFCGKMIRNEKLIA